MKLVDKPDNSSLIGVQKQTEATKAKNTALKVQIGVLEQKKAELTAAKIYNGLKNEFIAAKKELEEQKESLNNSLSDIEEIMLSAGVEKTEYLNIGYISTVKKLLDEDFSLPDDELAEKDFTQLINKVYDKKQEISNQEGILDDIKTQQLAPIVSIINELTQLKNDIQTILKEELEIKDVLEKQIRRIDQALVGTKKDLKKLEKLDLSKYNDFLAKSSFALEFAKLKLNLKYISDKDPTTSEAKGWIKDSTSILNSETKNWKEVTETVKMLNKKFNHILRGETKAELLSALDAFQKQVTVNEKKIDISTHQEFIIQSIATLKGDAEADHETIKAEIKLNYEQFKKGEPSKLTNSTERDKVLSNQAKANGSSLDSSPPVVKSTPVKPHNWPKPVTGNVANMLKKSHDAYKAINPQDNFGKLGHSAVKYLDGFKKILKDNIVSKSDKIEYLINENYLPEPKIADHTDTKGNAWICEGEYGCGGHILDKMKELVDKELEAGSTFIKVQVSLSALFFSNLRNEKYGNASFFTKLWAFMSSKDLYQKDTKAQEAIDAGYHKMKQCLITEQNNYKDAIKLDISPRQLPVKCLAGSVKSPDVNSPLPKNKKQEKQAAVIFYDHKLEEQKERERVVPTLGLQAGKLKGQQGSPGFAAG